MTWSDIIHTHFRGTDQEVAIKELCFNNHIATEREKVTKHYCFNMYSVKIN